MFHRGLLHVIDTFIIYMKLQKSFIIDCSQACCGALPLFASGNGRAGRPFWRECRWKNVEIYDAHVEKMGLNYSKQHPVIFFLRLRDNFEFCRIFGLTAENTVI